MQNEKTCKKQLISLHISREHQYGLSMNIVIVKFTKQYIGRKVGIFMSISHVRVYSVHLHKFATREIRKIKISRFFLVMHTQRQLQ